MATLIKIAISLVNYLSSMDIVSYTRNTWFKQYSEEKLELEIALHGRTKIKKSEREDVIERLLPWMSNLFGIYEKCNVYQKHAIVRGVFKDNLAKGRVRLEYLTSTRHLKIT